MLFYTKEETDKIIKTATETEKAIFMLLLNTGLKTTEAIDIKINDIIESLDTNFYSVIVKMTYRGRDRKYTTWGDERTIKIDKYIIDKLLNIFKSKTYLIETKTGKQYNRVYLNKIFKELERKSNIVIKSETIRNTFIINKLDSGENTDEIGDYIGGLGQTLRQKINNSIDLSYNERKYYLEQDCMMRNAEKPRRSPSGQELNPYNVPKIKSNQLNR